MLYLPWLNGVVIMETIKIKAISEGIAYGRALNVNDDFIIKKGLCSNSLLERQLFRQSVNEVIKDLEALKSDEVFKDEEFLDVHIMILKDPVLFSEVDSLIESKRYYAERAFDTVINGYIEKFNGANSVYLKERNLDFKDIRSRVLKKLNRHYFKENVSGKLILVCNELYPSLLMEFKDNVAGVISCQGGQTSHGAILCKAREIPYIIYDGTINEGTSIIIDTRTNSLMINVPKEIIKQYHDLKKELKKKKRMSDYSKYKLKIMANVSANEDISKVMDYNMYGVGLYRTEFVFMNLDHPMSYNDQFRVYSDAVDMLNGKCITFRTFDIGDDKQLSYMKVSHKGVDNYRNNKDLFQNQVLAMMNANKYSNMKIMFPMIETIDEFKYLRDWTIKLKREASNDSYVKIGMMLETKKALENISDFKDIDFMSIGTNDLTSELYHLNRNEILNYNAYIDSLIEKLKAVVCHCQTYNIELSICGELAGVPEVFKRLYDIGIRQFSISPSNAKAIDIAIKECVQ